jgi:hypothetical protein
MKREINPNLKTFTPYTPSLRQQIQINLNLFLGKKKPLKFLKDVRYVRVRQFNTIRKTKPLLSGVSEPR